MALNFDNIDNEVVQSAGRIKVQIQCNQCREKFILRGSYDKNGNLETGFKMCLCGNADDIAMTSFE